MIATPTQESEAYPATLAGLTSPHGRANGLELAPLSGAEGCALRAKRSGLQSEGLAIAVRALLGRLGQNFHFLLQATAQ